MMSAKHESPHPPRSRPWTSRPWTRARRRAWWAPIVALLVLGHAVSAAEVPSEPILRIDTDLHSAPINAIAVDRVNEVLATVSYDKTLRLWSLADGRRLKTLRIPIGPGGEGHLYRVALTPDGRTAAVSGWTGSWDEGWSIYLFDTVSGRIVRRITDLPHRAVSLAFSRDGSALAVAMKGGEGIRVYSAPDYLLAAEDSDYDDDAVWVDFSPDGHLAASSLDGRIRLYDATFRRIAITGKLGGRSPFCLRFSPDGRWIAVGYLDRTQIDVLAAEDLTLAFSPDSGGADNGYMQQVAWSLDGRYLYAGGSYERRGSVPIRRWADGGRGRFRDLPVARKRVMNMAPLAGGGLAFATDDPSFGVLDSRGRKVFEHRSPVGDFRGLGDRFLLSRDGQVVEFEYTPWGGEPFRFAFRERALAPAAEASGDDLFPAITEAAGLDIQDWENDLHDWGRRRTPTLNGRPLSLQRHEMSTSVAVAPDASRFLVGTNWRLIAFDSAGTEIWSFNSPGETLAVNVSRDGRLAVAALGDGTIRWFRMEDGRPLVTLFPHKDGRRWVAWTAAGYYMASPEGDRLVGWHVNRGPDRAADFFPIHLLRERFYRPDVVDGVLETLDEPTALRRAGAPAESSRSVRRILPPVVEIRAPETGSVVSDSPIEIHYALRAPSGEPITALSVLADGRILRRYEDEPPAGPDETLRRRVVPIPNRDSEISLIAENRFAASVPSSVRLDWRGIEETDPDLRPTLFVLAVGVGRYRREDISLGFPAKDARDFADAMLRQKGRTYGDVQVRLLTDGDATLENVLKGLDWIRSHADGFGVTMVFLAGHGIDDAARRYYFLPHDGDPDRLAETALSYNTIKDTLTSLAGRAVLFVDTCFSGSVFGRPDGRSANDVTRLINDLSSSKHGVVVFASSTGEQVSLESSALNNGAFTKALIEGLEGRARMMGRDYITVAMLNVYVSERVRDLTGGRQTPTLAIPRLVADFQIARFP